MPNLRRNRTARGFTLIELMISVALIGALATIAIPNFVRWQAKTRRSEAMANLSAIGRAEKALYAERNRYVETPAALNFPDPSLYGGLGTHKMPWDAASRTAFRDIGWVPEGEVFYSYAVGIPVPAGGSLTCGCTACFSAGAYGDADGNNSVTGIIYISPDTGGGSCPDPIMGGGPPVDPGSGMSVYDAPGPRSNADF